MSLDRSRTTFTHTQLDVQIYGPFGHVGGAGFSLLANCVKLYVLEQTEIIDREHSSGEIQQKKMITVALGR